ncbi:MAG: DUF2442 domain-containing protein [Sediminibacterium sp.]|jgi:hypothetical protein
MNLAQSNTIQSVTFSEEKLLITVNEIDYSFNLKDISLKLLNATKEERNQFEISPANYGIHWPLIDEDLSIKGLINKSSSK